MPVYGTVFWKHNIYQRYEYHAGCRGTDSGKGWELQGHYGYYGITFNYRAVSCYYERVRRMLHKWLNRRGGKPSYIWERFAGEVLERHRLVMPRIVHKHF